MSSRLIKAAFALAFLTALAACTNPSQSHLLPPAPTVGQIHPMDDTPPPCGTACDSGGGLPGHGP